MDNDIETEPKPRITHQQLNLKKWTNLERMQLNFEKHQVSQLDQENESSSHLDMVNREQCKY